MLGTLWEREPVIAAAVDLLERARAGHGGALFVTGDAGTGKTAVLDAALGRAGGALDCARARGEEMEAGIALGTLDQVLRALDDELPARSAAAEPSTPYLHALERIERRGSRPLVIALDDLHWADADSLNVFAFLARRLAHLPVALIATLRPWPPAAHDACGALVDQGRAQVVRLAPLTRAAAGSLLEERFGEPLPAAAEPRAWELCHGNPLLIEQLALALRGNRALLDSRDGESDLARRLFVTRFAGLDERSLRYARCASVIGTSFRPEVALAIAELPQPDVEPTLEALYRSGLVTDDGDDRLRFVHALVGQALYEELTPAVRRRLHGRAFEQLARRGLSDEAAEHAIRADLTGDARAAALLERVGRAALRGGAVAAAVRSLDAATRFRGDRAAPQLLLALAEALCASGRIPVAADVLRRLLVAPELSWSDEITALTLLGRCQYMVGDLDRGEAVLERAVSIAEAHDPARAVLPLLDQVVSTWMTAGPIHALPLATRARELARGGDLELRETADAIWGNTAAECGDPDGIAATLPIARRVRGEGGSALRAAELLTPRSPIYAYAHCAQYAERFDDALAALELAREQIQLAGAANALATVSIFIGNQLIRRGRLHAALDAADRAERFSDLASMAIPFAALTRAQALLWLGRVEESRAEAERAEAAAAGQWTIDLWVAYVRGLRQLWEGDPASSDAFLEVERVARAAGVEEPANLLWAGHAIAAHIAAGRVDDAIRVLEQLEDRAAVLSSRWPGFAARVGRARLAEHVGDDAAASVGYRMALDHLGDVDLPLQRVEGLLAYGGLLRRRGRQLQARPQLAEALRIAELHDAAPLAQAAHAELRLAGGRRSRGADPDLLTPAEARVARVAAAGLSNAEIAHALHVSVNTVETHLKRVYAKLGISGRRRLAGVDLDARSQPAVEPAER